jgi:uncharacterized protein YecE (DUF72 family)
MIYIGTCSWAEKTLLDSRKFYPSTIKTAEDRLRYYAGIFRTVEVDATYYALPAKRTVWLWSQRTPENFVFHVKAYGALTGHGINPQSLPKELRAMLPSTERDKKYLYLKDPYILKTIADHFLEALYPLQRENKLGFIVFQYPPWFRYSTKGLDYILACKNLMKGIPIAVEFRHGSWLTEKTLDSVTHFLRKHQITYVTADEPQYGTLATIPFIPQATTDIAYFRFHGRNRENWLRKGIPVSLRYDYEYSDDELKEFIPVIRNMSKRTNATYIMFNNCHGASAVKNALRMMELLGE